MTANVTQSSTPNIELTRSAASVGFISYELGLEPIDKGGRIYSQMKSVRVLGRYTESENLQDLRKKVDMLHEKVDWLIHSQRNLERVLKDIVVEGTDLDNQDMSSRDIRDLILENYETGKVFYPSDIADKYGLDYDAVVKAIDILRSEGRIKDEE